MAPVHHFGGRGGAQRVTKWSTRYKSLFVSRESTRAYFVGSSSTGRRGVLLTKAEKGAFERRPVWLFVFSSFSSGVGGGAILRLVEGV